MSDKLSPLSLADCVQTACLLDVMAAKPGNVHRGADFEDLTCGDFLLAGQAIAPILAQAGQRSVGDTILAAVQATRNAIGTNANLGIILLLTPLAAVPREREWHAGVNDVLQSLNAEDARNVYAAIGAANPGGMGKVDDHDLAAVPPDDLLIAMRAAAERDSIARQYAKGYADIATIVLPALLSNLKTLPTLSAIVRTFLQILAAIPDTLIARKCGPRIAGDASEWAGEVLAAGEESTEAYYHAMADLDFWLRSDGHRRNPGTTADLVCAALFIALRDGLLTPPFRWE